MSLKSKWNQFTNWLGQKYDQFHNWTDEKLSQLSSWWNNSKFIKDLTGQTQIEQQNAANMEMAKYQAQMNEEFYNKYSSPDALMRQYQEAGLNPNLVYGSAGSGQGNVPSFTAPHVERNMSGADKINKALSMLSGLAGLKQQFYQTDAAREVAEQAGIKTLNDVVNLRRNRMDTELQGEILGWNGSGYTGKYKRGALGRLKNQVTGFIGDQLPTFERYAGAVRAQKMNDYLRSAMSNVYDYGGGFDLLGGNLYLDDGLPYMQVRNRQSQFNYEWDQDYKTYLKKAGVASPIIQTLIRILGK